MTSLIELRAALAKGLQKEDIITLLYAANIPAPLKLAAVPMVISLPVEAMEKLTPILLALLEKLETGDLDAIRQQLNAAGVPPAWAARIIEYAASIH
jgi:hypothetical protein